MFVHWLCDWTSVYYRLHQGHGDSFLCFRPPVSSLLFITQLSFSLFSESSQLPRASERSPKKKKSDSVGKAHWWLTQRVAQNTFKVSGKQKMCNFHQLTTTETGQVCLSVNTGGALSAWKYCSVHSSHTDYTSSFMLTARQLSVNGSVHGCCQSSFFYSKYHQFLPFLNLNAHCGWWTHSRAPWVDDCDTDISEFTCTFWFWQSACCEHTWSTPLLVISFAQNGHFGPVLISLTKTMAKNIQRTFFTDEN